MKITEKEKKILYRLKKKRLQKVYCLLNSWKTPKEFKYLESSLSKMRDPYDSNNIRSLLMHKIEQMIGEKSVSWGWWKYRKLGTIGEHDAWWYKEHKIDTTISKKYGKTYTIDKFVYKALENNIEPDYPDW